MSDLLIEEKNVKLIVPVETWEDSIRQAGQLLVDSNYVSNQYVNDMVNIVHEYGPYIVVFKNVALAHAKAGEGVKKTGASLIRLKEPVVFGNEENDPVSIVIALASVNSTDHLEFLQQIMIAFSYDAKNEIMSATSNKEVINIFEKYKEEEIKNEKT